MARRGRPARYRARRSAEFSDASSERGFLGKGTWVALSLFVLALCCALTIPVIPQYQKTKLVEGELDQTKERERLLRHETKELEAQARALRNNQSYLKARARDLRYYLPGESVIQMDR